MVIAIIQSNETIRYLEEIGKNPVILTSHFSNTEKSVQWKKNQFPYNK